MRKTFALAGASVLVAATIGAQSQFPTVGMPEQPVVVRTAAATVRVSAIRGLVYPWALTFLPNGDMLVTEQGKNTLRRISQGVLDPTPITGLPQGITSTRRDTAGVDIVAHPEVRGQPLHLRRLLEAEAEAMPRSGRRCCCARGTTAARRCRTSRRSSPRTP